MFQLIDKFIQDGSNFDDLCFPDDGSIIDMFSELIPAYVKLRDEGHAFGLDSLIALHMCRLESDLDTIIARLKNELKADAIIIKGDTPCRMKKNDLRTFGDLMASHGMSCSN